MRREQLQLQPVEPEGTAPMWETRTVNLAVALPHDLAGQVEALQECDPDFLSRVVLYGLTRRAVYQHLREMDRAAEAGHGE